MIFTTTCPAAPMPIEEAPADLAAIFRWWLNVPDRAAEDRLQEALWGRRGVRFLCGDYVFWLGKEDDRSDVVKTMARWIDLPEKGEES
jgi:hypothetical protein